MSQAALARRVGLRQSTVNGIIRGEQRSSTKLHEIARELHTTPAYLSGETDDPQSHAPDIDLDSEEREWLDQIRSLSQRDRDAVFQLIRSLIGPRDGGTIHQQQQAYHGGGGGGERLRKAG